MVKKVSVPPGILPMAEKPLNLSCYIQALIIASEAAVSCGSLFSSTTGVVFMGTPHQGSELVPWAMLAANIANVAFGQALRSDLIEALKTGSGILAEISRAFVHLSTALRIMSFIETQVERPLTTLVRMPCLTKVSISPRRY